MTLSNSVQNKSDRNNSIDIFRIICAYMVVIIHIRPFEEINGDVSYFLAQIFARIAVPFFFCVMGYYLFKNIENEGSFKKTFISLLKPFLVWSFVYLVVFILLGLKNNNLTFHSFGKKILMSFVEGTSYHLWFFLGVFYNLILIFFAKKFKMIKPLAVISIICYLIGLLSTSYNGLLNSVPAVQNAMTHKYYDYTFRRYFGMGLPFLMMGFFLNKFIMSHKLKNKTLVISEVLLIFAFFLEMYIIYSLDLPKYSVTTLLLYPLVFNTFLLLYNNPLPKYKDFGNKCRRISSFIYFSHPLCILALNKLLPIITNSNNNQTITYFLTCTILTLIGLILYKFKDNKIIKSFY